MGLVDSISNNIMTSEKNNLILDRAFKSIVKFKGIACILIKNMLEEYKDLIYKQIAELIVDNRPKTYASDEELFQSEIDMLPSEMGDGVDKAIRLDVVFLIKRPCMLGNNSKLEEYNKVTIDFEIQDNKQDYSMTNRAVLYTDKLLSDTVHRGQKYKDIHKVYSVWLCNFNITDEFDTYGTEDDDITLNEYVHPIKLCRSYPGIPKASFDKVLDIQETVMVELPKLKRKNNDVEAMLNELFYNTRNSIDKIYEITSINLKKSKEVYNMFDLVKEVEEEKARAEEEKARADRAEAEKENMIKSIIAIILKQNKGKGKENVIKMAAHNLSIPEEDVQYVYAKYFEKINN